MIENLLNQKAVWSKFLKKNQYGENSYGPPMDVMVRSQKEVNVVRNGKGEEISTNHKIFTFEKMSDNDQISIDGKNLVVITYKNNINGSGEEIVRTVFANG